MAVGEQLVVRTATKNELITSRYEPVSVESERCIHQSRAGRPTQSAMIMTITEITLAGVQFSQHSRRLGSDVSAPESESKSEHGWDGVRRMCG